MDRPTRTGFASYAGSWRAGSKDGGEASQSWGFESLGPGAGSSLPTDEHGDSEGKQDHADGQPGPRTPFVIALLPTGHRGADGSGSGPVQIGHVEQRDAEAGYQAGQSDGRVLSPDQQHRCEHRQRQHEQSNRRYSDEAHGVARANKEPGREPRPRQS